MWQDEYASFEKCGQFCSRVRRRECQNVDLYELPSEKLCLGPAETKAGCDTCGKWTDWAQAEKCELGNCDKQIKQTRDCVDSSGMLADDCRGSFEELKDCRCSDFVTTTTIASLVTSTLKLESTSTTTTIKTTTTSTTTKGTGCFHTELSFSFCFLQPPIKCQRQLLQRQQ